MVANPSHWGLGYRVPKLIQWRLGFFFFRWQEICSGSEAVFEALLGRDWEETGKENGSARVRSG